MNNPSKPEQGAPLDAASGAADAAPAPSGANIPTNTNTNINTNHADDWVAVGEIVGAFGVHGELKVRPLTDFPERFERTSTIYVGEEHTPYPIEGAHQHKQQVLLRLAGVDDMTSAERLRGAVLWIQSGDLMPLGEDQYYQHDLIGLTVRHVNGAELGTVTDVLPSGAHDLLIVRNAHTGAEAMLPAVKAFITQIDLAGGTITVDPIPGLFDEDFENAE